MTELAQKTSPRDFYLCLKMHMFYDKHSTQNAGCPSYHAEDIRHKCAVESRKDVKRLSSRLEVLF